MTTFTFERFLQVLSEIETSTGWFAQNAQMPKTKYLLLNFLYCEEIDSLALAQLLMEIEKNLEKRPEFDVQEIAIHIGSEVHTSPIHTLGHLYEAVCRALHVPPQYAT